MIRSAGYRIAVVYSAAFAAAVILLGFGVYVSADRGLRRELDGRIAAEVSSLASEYRSEGVAGLRVVVARRETARATNDLGYALYAPHGDRVAGLLNAPKPQLGWQTLEFRDPIEGADEARALAADLPGGYRLVVAADWDDLVATERVIVSIFAVAFVLVLALGAAGATILGGYLRRRLSQIGRAAESIVGGDLGARIPVGHRRDEFDRAALALNIMLDRISELLDNLRQVSSDIAHDLRTPLGRLRGRLEEGLGAGEPKAVIARAIADTDEAMALFSAILRLSEIEAGQLGADFVRVDLSALVREMGESYQPVVEDGGRRLVSVCEPDLVVRGDRELLAQALVNLLDNAQIHTSAGTVISLSLSCAGTRVELTVADDGVGVPESDRGRVVGRFARLDRSRSLPGHGLGLSLVAAIARAHGATLVLGDEGPGLRVTLSFPQ